MSRKSLTNSSLPGSPAKSESDPLPSNRAEDTERSVPGRRARRRHHLQVNHRPTLRPVERRSRNLRNRKTLQRPKTILLRANRPPANPQALLSRPGLRPRAPPAQQLRRRRRHRQFRSPARETVPHSLRPTTSPATTDPGPRTAAARPVAMAAWAAVVPREGGS